MPLTYATEADLDTYTDGADTPDNVGRLLGYASRLVRSATRTAVYDTTSTGAPSDPDVADAFRDATCAQVTAWINLRVDPTTGRGGVTGSPQSSSIGSGTVNYGNRPGADDDRAATIDQLVPEALAYLQDVPTRVTIWG